MDLDRKENSKCERFGRPRQCGASQLSPHLPVQHPVIDGFVEVRRLNVLAVVEVGDRPADAEDFVVGPGTEPEVVDARAKQLLAVAIELAELADLAAGHPEPTVLAAGEACAPAASAVSTVVSAGFMAVGGS